jgi:hypothetical protein
METPMRKDDKNMQEPPEVRAISAVYSALKSLDQPARIRVVRYAAEMLGLTLGAPAVDRMSAESHEDRQEAAATTSSVANSSSSTQSDDIDGISAVALKWMKRSGLETKNLQNLFSLGIDEIDLVARSVPGVSKREKMHNVILLKGIAAYLGTGVSRITHEQLKEACLHYNAYDATNFARYLKSFASDVGGAKESGYTLTARGLSAGTDLVKELLGTKLNNT